MQKSTLSWVAGLSACVPMLVLAQPAPSSASPQPAAAPLKYSSAYADYKPFQELEPGSWRALNDAVAAAAAKPGGAGAAHGQMPGMPAPKAGMPAHDMKSMPAHDMKAMPGMQHPKQGGKP